MLEPMVAPAPKIADIQVSNLLVQSEKEHEHTSIPHLLSKLLPVCVQLALFSRRLATAGNIQRHVAIARLHRRRRWVALFVYDGYIGSGEDALKAGPLIASLGPVGIHELCDEDTVVGEDS